MKEKVAIVSILANFFLAGFKITVGYFSNSASVLAEGFHSLTDIFSSAIGYFGIKAATRPADDKHPYGHYKVEVLSGFAITFLLFATGVGIVYDAYKNYLNPAEVAIGNWLFGIMIFSVAVNFATAKIKIYYGKKENSLTLLSDGSHDYADVLASLAVLAGLFLNEYWLYADSFLAGLIGIYIIKESFALGKEATDSLLDVSAGEEIENKIKALAKTKNIELKSLKTQKKGSMLTANLEIKLPGGLRIEEATKLSDSLKDLLMEKIENLKYVAIQISSYQVERNFYRPAIGRGFGWQRKSKPGKAETEEEKEGKGPEGDCVCPKCGYKTTHERGKPCAENQCPHCSVPLERK